MSKTLDRLDLHLELRALAASWRALGVWRRREAERWQAEGQVDRAERHDIRADIGLECADQLEDLLRRRGR